MKLFNQEVLRVILLDTRYRGDRNRQSWPTARKLILESLSELAIMRSLRKL
jgi:hypothetical protein